MNITTDKIDKSTVVMNLSGRLDTANAPLLERKIKQWGDDISEIILDFSKLDYISSLGLRILLQAQKMMKERKGRLVIKNIGESVREVFEITGFLKLMMHEERFVAIRQDEGNGIVLSLNGEMRIEDIPAVAKELSDIREQKLEKSGIIVILDMGKLTHVSPGTFRHLGKAIADTEWEGRDLRVRNASLDIQAALKEEGLKQIL